MKYKHILLILPVLFVCIQACKKVAAPPEAKVTVVGKWFIIKHDLKLIKDGVQIGETIKTDYTADDFAQFYKDGTGYQSAKGTANSPSLTIFHYTLKDSSITLYINGNPGVVETITRLTETGFAVHFESQVIDPNNPTQIYTGIEEYEFKR
ncbi:hypothetical protein [Mucilaginibacter sp.]|uniref:hypothetical protein n=1 Tax=Mucilaginibacter sp. TaxID=1882438 RepID=UPI00260F388F|nr:hypothetical protein [Mucilaginibacter sp.]MDB4919875.1 hypothetical protein [Mucilaginibacter sp.]